MEWTRSLGLQAVVGIFCVVAAFPEAAASDESGTLVLPLRAIGVSDTTVEVVGYLLRGELEGRGIVLVPASRAHEALSLARDGCDDPECANAAGVAAGARHVIYGSLSRLGSKIILAIRGLRVGDPLPDYSDQLVASSEEDLDTVIRRVAESFAAGRPNAQRPSVDTVTEEETLEPRRRASRSGLGLRAGFVFPVDQSYGDVDRLTSLRLSIRYETRNYHVETTPLLGFAWRGETLEWTPFDLFVARLFGKGDFAPFIGAGLGISALHVEHRSYVTYGTAQYPVSSDESETTIAGDIGAGFLVLRTYDFVIVFDLRYHYVFADFDAHGLSLRLGISR